MLVTVSPTPCVTHITVKGNVGCASALQEYVTGCVPLSTLDRTPWYDCVTDVSDSPSSRLPEFIDGTAATHTSFELSGFIAGVMTETVYALVAEAATTIEPNRTYGTPSSVNALPRAPTTVMVTALPPTSLAAVGVIVVTFKTSKFTRSTSATRVSPMVYMELSSTLADEAANLGTSHITSALDTYTPTPEYDISNPPFAALRHSHTRSLPTMSARPSGGSAFRPVSLATSPCDAACGDDLVSVPLYSRTKFTTLDIPSS